MAIQRYSAAQVAAALTESRGLVTYAARRLGCTRNTIQHYVDRYELVRQARNAAIASFVDEAELALAELVRARNPQAIFFVLRTLGKERGYGDEMRVDVTVQKKQPLELTVDYDDYARAFKQAMALPERTGDAPRSASTANDDH